VCGVHNNLELPHFEMDVVRDPRIPRGKVLGRANWLSPSYVPLKPSINVKELHFNIFPRSCSGDHEFGIAWVPAEAAHQGIDLQFGCAGSRL
jgi:hypothetical protein